MVAHEVGHHVQFDLDPKLEAATADAVANAVANAATIASAWRKWSEEAFADTWSVLMVGGAAVWTVAQLLAADPATLVAPIDPKSDYPPPLVRLALLGEIGRELDLDWESPAASDVLALLGTEAYAGLDPEALDEHRAHLEHVPSIASALLDVPTGKTTVRLRSGFSDRLLGADGTATRWTNALFDDPPVIDKKNRVWSARTLTAASADAARRVNRLDPKAREHWFEKLRDRILTMLPTFGEEGTLSTAEEPDTAFPTADLATELVTDLFDEVR